jgi:hypothetical protein
MSLPGIAIGAGITIGGGIFMGAGPAPSVNGSILLNGTNYLTVPNNTAFDQNSGAWTVESFVYPTANVEEYIYMQNTVGFLGIVYYYGNFRVDQRGNYRISSPSTYALNNWYHVAMTYNGAGTVTLWVGGVSVGTWASSGLVASALTTQIGCFDSGSNPFSGNISNLRVVKGVAVYTGAFTPPTAPLTTTQGSGTNISAITGTQTQLLLNNYQGAGFLTDASTNNFTVTNIGSVTSSALNPF